MVLNKRARPDQIDPNPGMTFLQDFISMRLG
jgi:hypothetical protein